MASGEQGGVAASCHFPANSLADSCQAGGTFFCVPDVSFAPLPSIAPRASLPPGVVPHPRCRREGTHMSDAAAWYGWLRQRMECPQPWPMAPHASAALPAPPPPRPALGAGWERRLPPRSARCCHRARCSAPRRAGGMDGRAPLLGEKRFPVLGEGSWPAPLSWPLSPPVAGVRGEQKPLRRRAAGASASAAALPFPPFASENFATRRRRVREKRRAGFVCFCPVIPCLATATSSLRRAVCPLGSWGVCGRGRPVVP